MDVGEVFSFGGGGRRWSLLSTTTPPPLKRAPVTKALADQPTGPIGGVRGGGGSQQKPGHNYPHDGLIPCGTSWKHGQPQRSTSSRMVNTVREWVAPEVYCSRNGGQRGMGCYQGCIRRGGRGGLKGGGRGVWLGPPSSLGPPMAPAENFEAYILLTPKAPKQNFGCQHQTLEGEEGGGVGTRPQY